MGGSRDSCSAALSTRWCGRSVRARGSERLARARERIRCDGRACERLCVKCQRGKCARSRARERERLLAARRATGHCAEAAARGWLMLPLPLSLPLLVSAASARSVRLLLVARALPSRHGTAAARDPCVCISPPLQRVVCQRRGNKEESTVARARTVWKRNGYIEDKAREECERERGEK